MQRRQLLSAAVAIASALVVAAACSSQTSTLRQLGTPTGVGPVDFQVENRTDAIVNNLYLAKTERVKAAPRQAFESATPEQAALWGDDLLRSGLEPGGKLSIAIDEPGTYDARLVDRDGNEQHVAGLRLQPGGRYVLEVHDNWRRPL